MTTAREQAMRALAELTGPGGAFELIREDVLGEPMTVFRYRDQELAELVAESASYGDRDYLVTSDRRIGFADHARQVASLAAALRERYGVAKGDRVGILAANSPEWITVFWATVSLGAIAVGYNAWWSPPEVRYAVGHTRPSLLVADAGHAAHADGLDVPVLAAERDVPALAAAYPGAPLPRGEAVEDDPAVIVYTSGTSGRPKGVLHSHRSLLAIAGYHRLNDALAAAAGDPANPMDRRYLLGLPLFHIAGLHNLVVPRMATGSAAVIHEGGFDAGRVLRLVEKQRVTNWAVVPTMASRLLREDLGRYDLSSLRTFTLASAPSSPALKERVRAALPRLAASLVDSYGQTESGTAITIASPFDLADDPATVGRPIVTVELEIRDEQGNPLPEGHEGEVCARSPFTMLGYWADEQATERALRPGRWLHTGDIGVVEHGRLRLTTRRSDLIVRGGENVSPVEVQNVLDAHPSVDESVVLGVPHDDLGQEVAAVVVTRAGITVSEAELARFAGQRLARFKVPSRWRITTSPLPRGATGKVLRRDIRTG